MARKASTMETSSSTSNDVVQLDPVWVAVREEAQAIVDSDPAMSGFILIT